MFLGLRFHSRYSCYQILRKLKLIMPLFVPSSITVSQSISPSHSHLLLLSILFQIPPSASVPLEPSAPAWLQVCALNLITPPSLSLPHNQSLPTVRFPSFNSLIFLTTTPSSTFFATLLFRGQLSHHSSLPKPFTLQNNPFSLPPSDFTVPSLGSPCSEYYPGFT